MIPQSPAFHFVGLRGTPRHLTKFIENLFQNQNRGSRTLTKQNQVISKTEIYDFQPLTHRMKPKRRAVRKPSSRIPAIDSKEDDQKEDQREEVADSFQVCSEEEGPVGAGDVGSKLEKSSAGYQRN
uniref:Uncharacterized protein n=1 Tax=Cannabis sativa TaxID=3483 RepID=A0A803QE16_CANSA